MFCEMQNSGLILFQRLNVIVILKSKMAATKIGYNDDFLRIKHPQIDVIDHFMFCMWDEVGVGDG